MPAARSTREVPKALDAICLKAMATRKEDRYQTALELAEDVQRFVAGEPVSAYREGFAARAWRWAKRHRKALGRVGGGRPDRLGPGLFGYARSATPSDRRAAAARGRPPEGPGAGAARPEGVPAPGRRGELFRRHDQPGVRARTLLRPAQGRAPIATRSPCRRPWGPTLEGLPLPEEPEPVKNELYDLLLARWPRRRPAGAADPARRDRLRCWTEPRRLRRRRAASTGSGPVLTGNSAKPDGGGRRAAGRRPADADDGPGSFPARRTVPAGSEQRDGPQRNAAGRAGSPTRPMEGRRAVPAGAGHRPGPLLVAPPARPVPPEPGPVRRGRGGAGACVALRPEVSLGLQRPRLGPAPSKAATEAERDLNQAVGWGPTTPAPPQPRRRLLGGSRRRRCPGRLRGRPGPAARQAAHRGRLLPGPALPGTGRGAEGARRLRPGRRRKARLPSPSTSTGPHSRGPRGPRRKPWPTSTSTSRPVPRCRRDGWEIHGLRGLVLRDLFTERSGGEAPRPDRGRRWPPWPWPS